MNLPTAGDLRRVRERYAEARVLRAAGYGDDHLNAGQREAERLWPTWGRYARALELGIPPRQWHADIKTGEPGPMLDLARAIVSDHAPHGRCVVISGPVGVGKSYLAAAVLLELPLPPNHPRQRYISVPELYRGLMDPELRGDAQEIALAPGLVVFDDWGLGYEKAGGFLASMFEEFMVEREAMVLPTVVTTNIAVAEFRGRLSTRILDRWQGPWGRVLRVNGKSRRQRQLADVGAPA